MQKHYYAVTDSSEAHNVALAFNNREERARYERDYNATPITAAEARKYNEVRHFCGRTENDWFSQLYPKAMWWR